jgi:hypothetical protein
MCWYFYRLPTRLLRSLLPRATIHRHPTGAEKTTAFVSELPWGQTRSGDDALHRRSQILDLGLLHLTIRQSQDSNQPPEQIDSSTRPIDQPELHFRQGDGQGDTGETDSRAQIPDLPGSGWYRRGKEK